MVLSDADHDELSLPLLTVVDHLSPNIEMVESGNLEAVLELEVGKIFDSEVDAFDYYRTYGNSSGFGVVTKSSKTNDNGVKSHVIFSCHRAGKHRRAGLNPIKPQPTSKTNCQAKIRLSLQINGKWRLNSFVLEHNHDLMDPEQTKYLKCNRIIPTHVKKIFELNTASGIRINKTMASCVLEAGGPQNLSFTEKTIRNYMDNVRRLQLKQGDAEAMSRYFRKMQRDNNDFFYAIDVDEENRLRNVFWADARSRQAYKEFGDVITFDTTYLVNRFDMPFAPFVGVNHHGQTILFGCGLVSHENTESFVWLFSVWLECMFDLSPNAIITDQCKAMRNAISQVFPNARHRWCLWHIMKKIPDKLKGYHEYEAIKFKIKNVVYDSLSANDFEENWGRLIEEHKLENDAWLRGLYEERTRWVPAFVKDTFWAGMSTTQRSESINAFFDGYVRASTTLKEFVEQYENALGKKVQKEEEEDARCKNVRVNAISPFPFEEQFQVAYTIAKFNEFQEQLAFLIGCRLSVKSVMDGVSKFTISQKKIVGKKRPTRKLYTFIVDYKDETSETNCNCRLFESKGMVCAHMISVWDHKMLEKVPEQYILKRWKKNLVRSHTNVKVSYSNWQSRPEWHRFDHIQNLSREAANNAMYSDAKTAVVVAKLTEANELMKKMGDGDYVNNVCISHKYSQEATKIVGDPIKGSRRGRPPENRLQPTTEVVVKKKIKKSSKSDKLVNVDIDNGVTECYRPTLLQEITNFCINVGDTLELDAELDTMMKFLQ